MNDLHEHRAENTGSASPTEGTAAEMFSRCRRYAPHALLATLVALVYLQTAAFGRLRWDDHLYVDPGAPGYRSIGADALADAFAVHPGHYGYRPLHLLSYMIEASLFGRNPAARHLVNVLLHLVNVLLVHHLARRLLGDVQAAFFGAALFAVFPYHVESVAWITERKGLLATFFVLLATHADLTFRRRGAWRFAAATCLLFACSLLSKSMWVVWPGVAFLVAVAESGREDVRVRMRTWLVAVAPVLGVLSVAGAAAQIMIGNATDVVPLGDGSVERLGWVAMTYVRYLSRFILPFETNPVDAWAWGPWPGLLAAGGAVMLLAGLMGASVELWRRGHRLGAVAFPAFLVSLLPVSNMVPMLYPHGDRHLYGPSLAVLLPLGWGLARLWRGWDGRYAPMVRRTLVAAVLLVYTVASIETTAYWSCDMLLWEYALRRNPRSQAAHFGMGAVYFDSAQHGRAVRHLEAALYAPPDRHVHVNVVRRAAPMLYRSVVDLAGETAARRAFAAMVADDRLPALSRWRCRLVLARDLLLDESPEATAAGSLLVETIPPAFADRPEARLLEAHRLVLVGDADAAEAILDDLPPKLNGPHEKAWRFFLRARIEEHRGNAFAARVLLAKAREARPDGALQRAVARREAEIAPADPDGAWSVGDAAATEAP